MFASLRCGSFFEGSSLSLIDLGEFLYIWCDNLQSTTFLKKNLVWCEPTITYWKNSYATDVLNCRLQINEKLADQVYCCNNESMFRHIKYFRTLSTLLHKFIHKLLKLHRLNLVLTNLSLSTDYLIQFILINKTSTLQNLAVQV